MARDTDFLDLYKILGLNPGCELAEFKQAYRRCVLVLHPDRRADGHPDAIAAERLQQLTALYGAAMAFQRQHGRLPGAAQLLPARAPGPIRSAAPVAPAPRRRSRRLLILVGVCVAGWLLWSFDPTPKPADTSSMPSATRAAHLIASPGEEIRHGANAALIHPGTHADTVRNLEGEPLIIINDRWEYGPSWILFDHGRVVDWYSSPMRPLKTAGEPSAPELP